MADDLKYFRTRIFGGFHRDDVLNYIRSNAEKTQSTINSLQKTIDELTETNTRLQKKVFEANEHSNVLQAELDKKTEELEQLLKPSSGGTAVESIEKEIQQLLRKLDSMQSKDESGSPSADGDSGDAPPSLHELMQKLKGSQD